MKIIKCERDGWGELPPSILILSRSLSLQRDLDSGGCSGPWWIWPQIKRWPGSLRLAVGDTISEWAMGGRNIISSFFPKGVWWKDRDRGQWVGGHSERWMVFKRGRANIQGWCTRERGVEWKSGKFNSSHAFFFFYKLVCLHFECHVAWQKPSCYFLPLSLLASTYTRYTNKLYVCARRHILQQRLSGWDKKKKKKIKQKPNFIPASAVWIFNVFLSWTISFQIRCDRFIIGLLKEMFGRAAELAAETDRARERKTKRKQKTHDLPDLSQVGLSVSFAMATVLNGPE